ncbi:MAG: hypothetical protein A3G57_03240 [Candidatus Andersenbacteria bacterium RIFCSPLOWO2_12_FULL_45_8]|nr:MAG: hypothetical protein A3G57_03240 [Candidatus Andersenbacteria bacterium RIFCSPLOWO2_12_FULL_45_8]
MKGSLATPIIYLDVEKTDLPVNSTNRSRRKLIGQIRSNCFLCGAVSDDQAEKSAGVVTSRLTSSANPVMG